MIVEYLITRGFLLEGPTVVVCPYRFLQRRKTFREWATWYLPSLKASYGSLIQHLYGGSLP